MSNEPVRVLGELVTFLSESGLRLDGILYREVNASSTIIHVHGSLGNFYQNQFLRRMAKEYGKRGINFLAFNLAGRDACGEGFSDRDDLVYIGGSISPFDECVKDIGGAVRYAEAFSNRVILQGHSLGCDRVLHYLISTQSRYDFVLLSPCDSYRLQANWIHPETVEAQIERLKKEQGNSDEVFDWLPSGEYGIRQEEWAYKIPITRRALLSIMEGPPFALLNIAHPATFYLDFEAAVYIGGCDPLQVVDSNVMYQYLEARINRLKRIYYPQGDHDLSGCETEAIQAIADWAYDGGR